MPRTVHVKRNFLYAFCAAFLCLCVNFQSVARANAEPLQGKEISISVRKSSLANILNQVSKKSGITIYFVDTDLAPYTNIDYDAKDKDVTNILAELFKGKDLLYEVISEKQIGVKKITRRDGSLSVERDTVYTISGTVNDEKGLPIIGATVTLKTNSQIGTTTSSSGSFVLSRIKENSTLVVSSVSFLTTEVRVQGRKNLGNITLKPFVGVLDEAVVIAYGTTSPRYNTGNINIIKGSEIQQQPLSNPLLAIAGRVPGVFVAQSSGVAGSGVKILIQGQNSISKGNEPFYVVDGVPYSSQLLPSLKGDLLGYSGVTNSQAGNPLNYINPSDIESITVLKDADATAIYGSRAANGAILITTKKSKAGNLSVEINLQHGVGEVTRRLQLLDTKQYLSVRREALANDGIGVDPTDYDINGFWDTTRQTDWQKELIGGTAQFSNASLSLSGGSALSNFLVSGTFRRETSVMPGGFSDKKAVIHFSQNSQSKDNRFSFQLSGNYLYDFNTLPGDDLTNTAINLAPDAPKILKEDGTLNWMPDQSGTSTWIPPYVSLYNEYSSSTKNLLANAIMSYKLLDGLDIKANMGYNNMSTDEISTFPLKTINPDWIAFVQRAASYRKNEINSWIVEPQITYKSKVGDKGKLEFLIGSTFQKSSSNSEAINGRGYSNDQVLKDLKAATNITIESTISSMYKYNAVFARINYIHADRYILNINARRDGSSRFGAANRFHNFGSVSGGWIFSEEDFLKGKISAFDFGKFRISYGTTGNDQIEDYKFLNLYTPYTVGSPYQGVLALTPVSLSNPYLQWEETNKFQIGLELGFLKDRIYLTSNYSKNTSSNQLLQYNLPIATGFTSISQNFPAKVANTSWEFSLNTKNVENRVFNWSTNLNLTVQKNKLLAFPSIESSVYSSSLVVGRSVNIVKVFQFHGVNPNTGIYEFVDSKGSITAQPDQVGDRHVVVDRLPSFYGGIQNSVSYKAFSLDFLFQFVKQRAQSYPYGFFPGVFNTNQPVSVLDRWQRNGDSKPIQRLGTFSNADVVQGMSNVLSSDASYSDASYVRLKNVSLSFDLNSIERIKKVFKSARMYIQAQNLITFTGYKGLDPENASFFNMPPLRFITLGMQVSF